MKDAKKPRILTVSSANMDFVMNVGAVPTAGQTVIESSHYNYRYIPGGKGANSATTFARLGAESIFCTRLGTDAHAKTLMKLYAEEGINTDYITEDCETPTGLAAIIVEPDGSNRIMVFPGANMKIERGDIEKAFGAKPDALYLQLEISCSANIAAAEIASAAGIPVFVDAGPADKAFPLDKLPTLEVFSPNETETEIFTGICPTSNGADSCLAAAKALSELVRAKYYCLKLGKHGCAVYDGEKLDIIPSFAVKAVDTTAAGDAFTAALVLEYLNCGDILKAARYANAAGALTVSRAGASSSLPTADEVKRFLAAR